MEKPKRDLPGVLQGLREGRRLQDASDEDGPRSLGWEKDSGVLGRVDVQGTGEVKCAPLIDALPMRACLETIRIACNAHSKSRLSMHVRRKRMNVGLHQRCRSRFRSRARDIPLLG